MVLFSLLSPEHRFISSKNLSSLSKLMPDLGIVALGIGLLMICGEFDLSVGSIISYTAFVYVLLVKIGINLFVTPFLTLSVGVLLGLINGLITVKGKIPSFITTLGTMMLWRGILLGQSGGYPQPLRQYLPEGSSQFINLFIGTIGPIPIQIIWFALFGLILSMLLHLHKFGNWVFATGNNKDAARAMGINTDTTKIISFAIVGFLCAFTAIIQTTRIEESYPLQGQFYELKAIAASVVGGTSLFGGVGSMPGIILGALIIQILENGLIIMQIPAIGIQAFVGIITILFVVFNQYLERGRMRMRVT
jgi:simple sugar transport system permease protein